LAGESKRRFHFPRQVFASAKQFFDGVGKRLMHLALPVELS